MKMIKYVTLIVLILSIFLTSCTVKTTQNDDNTMVEDTQNDAMMKNSNDDDTESDSMMIKKNNEEDSMMMIQTKDFSGNVLAGSTTKYIEFSKEDFELALSQNKIILLYFYANWCPPCKAEQVKVHAAFDELAKENVVGFRVNYKDSETDSFEESLAKEHGITYQHTKVILKDGERVLKAPDTWDKTRYIEEIEKVV